MGQALLEQAGARPQKETRFASLFQNRFFSGLWTQRNIMRDPSQVAVEKFYGGKPDALFDGVNIELTNNLTLARAPGSSPWSTATFAGAINSFYSFKQFNGSTESITVIVDEPATIDTLDPTAGRTVIFSKSLDAGAATFLGVGNILYFGDGAEQKAYQNGTVRNWGIVAPSGTAASDEYAGAAADTGGGTVAWSNPTNAEGSPDGAYASLSLGSVDFLGNTLSLSDYGFSGLTGTITGIQIVATCYSATNFPSIVPSINWQLSVNGGPSGNVKTTGFPGGTSGSPATVTLGSATDLWGFPNISLSAAEATTFGINATPSSPTNYPNTKSSNINIDAVEIIIYLAGPISATPTSTGTFSAVTGYQYVAAYGNSLSGAVSVATIPSVSTGPFTNVAYVAVGLTASTDPQVNQIWLFRTTDGGATFENLPTSPYPNTTQTIHDVAPDSSLNINQLADLTGLNTPPPAGLIGPAYHMGRIWGFVGNTLFYSSGSDLGNIVGNGNEGFPPLNFFIFPSKVTRLAPTSIGLIVFTVSDVYIVYGNGSALAASTGISGITVFYSTPFIQRLGLLSYYALDVNGTTLYVMSADGQVLSLDPSSGVSEIGFAISAPPSGFKVTEIANLAQYVSANAYVSWHVDGSADKALYVADGSTGWFRCNTSQAPQGDWVWSPKRNIVGGCQAVQSIETNPGNFQLLIGPGTAGGKVLVRNDSLTGQITEYFIASNIATFNITYTGVPGALNTFQAGQYVNISGTTGAGGIFNLNNQLITAIPAPGSIAIALTHTNAGPFFDTLGTITLANSDNGSAYPSNFKMGSIMLAHPGQVAEVAFLTMDFVRTGTSPQVSILLNEIKGTYENISGYVHGDPPSIYGISGNAESLYSNRYETMQSVTANPGQLPTSPCGRFMNIEVDYGDVDVTPNEMLSLSVFGTVFAEK